jgi:hypothetical protein
MAGRQTDPSPQEIRMRCLVIQKTWSVATEARRRTQGEKVLNKAPGLHEYILEFSNRDHAFYFRHV